MSFDRYIIQSFANAFRFEFPHNNEIKLLYLLVQQWMKRCIAPALPQTEAMPMCREVNDQPCVQETSVIDANSSVVAASSDAGASRRTTRAQRLCAMLYAADASNDDSGEVSDDAP